MAQHYVTSADGTRIAVYESGNPDGPTIVAVHGYPDNHGVWDGLARQLGYRYRFVSYDVRGCGESDKPSGRNAYRLRRLREDLTAVLDDVSPSAPVHLLAHDWGSIQSWDSVLSPDLAPRFASYVSISGPSLDHAALWLRNLPQHPKDGLKQLLHSYYIFAFQLPLLPERLWKSGVLDRLLPRDAARTEADKLNGLQLYRANMLGALTRPLPRTTGVPVLVVAPQDDAFVSVALATGAPVPYVPNLTTEVVPGEHWVVNQDPETIGRIVDQYLRTVAPQPTRG